jgi:hypothetical protein
MKDEHESGLGGGDRDALRGLREGPSAPAALEARVVAALRGQGLLGEGAGARGGGWRRGALLAAGLAASLAAFALGWWARGPGLAAPAAAPAGAARYVLLIHDTGTELPAAQEAALVREYGEWAAGLRRRGVAINGEKLEESRTVLASGGRRDERGSSRGALAGYFLLDAADPAAALAVAESCPHLRHGGTVELRRIAALGRG